MEVTSNSPYHSKPTAAKTLELGIMWAFRAATYAVLLCATIIFWDIFSKGGRVVFQTAPPFVNVSFLTEYPETLHIFKDVNGKEMTAGDKEFREYLEKNNLKDVEGHTSYVYSSGGIYPNIVGTFLLVVGSITIALIMGILSAIYLSEYSRKGKFIESVRLAIMNLAGVPSIVFGLFGFGLFVSFMPMIGSEPVHEAIHIYLPLIGYLNFTGWKVCLLSGWFTLAFMVLPIVITASEESLRAVPQGFRDGSLALGATKWQTIQKNVLPYAMPGILTSSVLGIARVAGETAPIMFTAAYVVRDDLPWQVKQWTDFFFQGVMALPYHIYVVSSKIPQNVYTAKVQYGTAFVFLFVVMSIALASILLRIKLRALYKW